jgi:RHS repeat-associated protein
MMHEDLPNNPGVVHHYTAEILSVQEQYAYGMNMPGRSFSVEEYRYGFNGKENQDELMANNSSQDFGARMYDVRVGRWWGMDYMKAKTPGVSPFVAMANNPILFVDPDGRENMVYIAFTETGYKNSFGVDGIDYLKAMKDLEDALNAILGKDHKVKVAFLPDDELAKSYLDETDAVIVLGPGEEVKKVSEDYFGNDIFSKSFKGSYQGNPEHTEENFVGIDMHPYNFWKCSNNDLRSTTQSSLVYFATHGVIHTTGKDHPSEQDTEKPWSSATRENQTIINSGEETKRDIGSGKIKDLTQALKNPNNKVVRKELREKFKGKGPQDNYLKNKALNSWKHVQKAKVKTRVKF